MTDERWERDALRDVALEGIRERRRARRWSIFFRLAFLIYLFLILFAFRGFDLGLTGDREETGPHAAVVKINGVIMADGQTRADTVIDGLRRAFEDSSTAGVILQINSPGGSPVQASQINNEILRLKEEYPDTPIYAVGEDMFTSGAYYLAVSTDKIFVDRATMIGSIGVLMNGFGFTDAMDKLGVQRRLYTAGDNKGLLDPFSEEREQDVAWINSLLDEIHEQFIEAVQAGRGDRLADDDDLFSGLVWTGEDGIRLGLADEIGSVRDVARNELDTETLRDFTPRPNILDRLAGRVGASFAEGISSLLLREQTPR